MTAPQNRPEPAQTGLGTSEQTPPVASPVGPGGHAAFGPVSGSSGPLTVPKDARSSGTASHPSIGWDWRGKGQRVGRRQRRALEASLAPRDRQVMQVVREHGFLTSQQVAGFCFTDHASLVPASAGRSGPTSGRVFQACAGCSTAWPLPTRTSGCVTTPRRTISNWPPWSNQTPGAATPASGARAAS